MKNTARLDLLLRFAALLCGTHPLKSQTEPASQGRECQQSASAAARPPARPPCVCVFVCVCVCARVRVCGAHIHTYNTYKHTASGSPLGSPLSWLGACVSLQQGAPASGVASLRQPLSSVISSMATIAVTNVRTAHRCPCVKIRSEGESMCGAKPPPPPAGLRFNFSL